MCIRDSLNSACTSFNSSSAFSTPRRAIVQKSAALLVTNASLSSFEDVSVLFEVHDRNTKGADKIRIRTRRLIEHSPHQKFTFTAPNLKAPFEAPEKTSGV